MLFEFALNLQRVRLKRPTTNNSCINDRKTATRYQTTELKLYRMQTKCITECFWNKTTKKWRKKVWKGAILCSSIRGHIFTLLNMTVVAFLVLGGVIGRIVDRYNALACLCALNTIVTAFFRANSASLSAIYVGSSFAIMLLMILIFIFLIFILIFILNYH